LAKYRQVEAFRFNRDLVVKAKYFIEIKCLLEALLSDPAHIETHRPDIQAYCHLLQYVANIETGTFASCTSLITESIDQRAPVRLTGTKTHENLIHLLEKDFEFCFAEDLDTKQSFLQCVS
jgi:hypothetical protein